MRTAELKRRMLALRDWADACTLANDLYGTEDKCAGCLGESFMAGWTNAADSIDEGMLDREDWQAVSDYVFDATRNYHSFPPRNG